MTTVKRRNWPTYADGQLNTPTEAREKAQQYEASAQREQDDPFITDRIKSDEYVQHQRKRATGVYDAAREMEQVGHLQPPAEIAALEDNLRTQRPDLDIYWSPSLAEGNGHDVVNWTLNADNPRGQDYAAIDFEVYDRHEALELVAEDPDEASKRRRSAHGWTNSHTHTAAAILQNTQIEATDGAFVEADLAAVELELVAGDDAEAVMRQTIEENADGWANFDPDQVNYQELKDTTAAEMTGIELDEDWESRLAGYKELDHGIAGQLKEITVRRGAYMESSEHGQTVDAVSETTPVFAENERWAQNQAGNQFVVEALNVPSKEHPQGKPEGIDPYTQTAMNQQQLSGASTGMAGPGQ